MWVWALVITIGLILVLAYLLESDVVHTYMFERRLKRDKAKILIAEPLPPVAKACRYEVSIGSYYATSQRLNVSSLEVLSTFSPAAINLYAATPTDKSNLYEQIKLIYQEHVTNALPGKVPEMALRISLLDPQGFKARTRDFAVKSFEPIRYQSLRADSTDLVIEGVSLVAIENTRGGKVDCQAYKAITGEITKYPPRSSQDKPS